jgi:aminoglycoside phosphotransferase (APT) family kinase protein
MPAPPSADRQVGPDDVRRLVADVLWEPGATRAELLLPARKTGEGWDTTSWRIGRTVEDGPHDLVLRVPRRDSAADLLGHELRVLRLLVSDPHPLRVPRVWGTVGPEDHPLALVLDWYEGVTAADLGAEVRAAVGRDLARMLARVHSTPLVDLPRNPVRGVDLARRDVSFREDLAEAVDLGEATRTWLREVWEQGLAAPRWEGPDLLLHGDPHPGNLVVPTDGDGQVLIDWGDTTPGDPASDLGALFLYGADDPDRPGESADGALAAYRAAATWPGAEDDRAWSALVCRSRAWGVRYSLTLGNAYPASDGLGAVARRMWARLG